MPGWTLIAVAASLFVVATIGAALALSRRGRTDDDFLSDMSDWGQQ